jgi:adenylosuccinate synthase
MIGDILGIIKAYTTRVGQGPFPTELLDETGEQLRERGAEYGATTGRPRRCGWFDLIVARYAVMINSLSFVALTKLDVLDSFDEVKICTAYKINDEILDYFPADASTLDIIEPVYKSFPGWKSSTVGIEEFDKLPENAQKYIKALEELMECPIAIVSTGACRHERIILHDAFSDLR